MKVKQHLVLSRGKKVIKKLTIFSSEKSEAGFFVKKALNYPAKDFYTEIELDELMDIGVTYEVVS